MGFSFPVSLPNVLASISVMMVCGGCAAVAPFASVITDGGAPMANLEVHSETSVRLQDGNFATIRTNVVGRSKGFKLLGFITIVPATLGKAMDRLYANAQAQHGRPQTLAHLIVERSGVYVILFSIPEVTVRADLIEFLPLEYEEESYPERPNLPRGAQPIADRMIRSAGAAEEP